MTARPSSIVKPPSGGPPATAGGSDPVAAPAADCRSLQVMKSFKFEISNLKSLAPAARRLLLTATCLLPVAICLLPTEARAAAWQRQQTGTFAWLHAVYFVDERRGWAV